VDYVNLKILVTPQSCTLLATTFSPLLAAKSANKVKRGEVLQRREEFLERLGITVYPNFKRGYV
jgi:hypothetical protein